MCVFGLGFFKCAWVFGIELVAQEVLFDMVMFLTCIIVNFLYRVQGVISLNSF